MMAGGRSWASPDGTIKKLIVVEGGWGLKPAEQSECDVEIVEGAGEMEKFDGSTVVVGDNDGAMGRVLDKCLLTMNEGETASFTVSENLPFTVHLTRVVHAGLIHQWGAEKKMAIALHHKEKGVALFKRNAVEDAAFRFVKALKIVSSVPVDVENHPADVEGVAVEDVDQLKANLFGNLASCYLKFQAWPRVVDACNKVFVYDKDNVKARYKMGVAHMGDRDFERAQKAFEAVLEIEPDNGAAVEKLRRVREEVQRADAKFNNLVRKMFV